MKNTFLLGISMFCGALALPGRPALAQNFSTVATSELAEVPLPSQTLRFAPKDVPREVSDALESMMQSSGPNVTRGRTEVLGWTGNGYTKANAKAWKARIATALQKGGWQYEEGDKVNGAQGTTMVSAFKTSPRKALIGFWAPMDEALVLAWTEMLPAQNGEQPADNGNPGIVPPGTPNSQVPTTHSAPDADNAPKAGKAPADATIFTLSDNQRVVNVMKNAVPTMPTFPTLAPQPGKVCGFVKDTNGKPLKGALIGVRSTAVGGAKTSAQAKTDERGYYEILAPFGAAGFFCAGYTRDWGEGRGALGLRPADGEADEFATPKGHVENWVLVPYGIADLNGASDQPQYLNNYFGGSLTVELRNQSSGFGHGLRDGMTVEITLTPQGPLLDGSQGRAFVFRKIAHDGGMNTVRFNNIPVGNYRVSVREVGGGALNFKEFGPYREDAFGIDPKTAQGNANLVFRPYSAQTDLVSAGHGNWKETDIEIFN